MKPLLTAAQMRRCDARAIEEARVPGLVLMENAGQGTFVEIASRLETLGGSKVVLVCGKGNNGGDGFVLGRHLCNAGAQVRAYLFGKKAQVKGDARANLDAFVGVGGDLVEDAGKAPAMEELRADLWDCDVAADALLGTGLEKDVEGEFARAIALLNESPCIVVSLDIPSGICSDSGAVRGAAVEADLTCTYGAFKVGQWQYPGRERCGELVEIPISIPPPFYEAAGPNHFLLSAGDVWPGLLSRPPDAHKGHFGHLLVVAGSHGKSGAAVLSCLGAHRVGAGLVTLAVPRSLEAVAAPQSPETMTALLDENSAGGISEKSAGAILDLLKDRSGLLLGPGIPTDPETGRSLQHVLERAQGPLVIDADGLNLLAKAALRPGGLSSKQVIVTPHPGEMARLLGKKAADVQAARIEMARAYATQEKVICVLKGAGTVVAAPDGAVYISPFGNPGLASGGTGDVLAGMIAGILAQEGPSPLEAACSGVILHGLSADRIAGRRGAEAGLLAGDVALEIPAVLHDLVEGEPGEEPEGGGCGDPTHHHGHG